MDISDDYRRGRHVVSAARLAAFNSDDDHVHPLVEYPPKVAVPALVTSLKGVSGVSARMPRAEFTSRVNQASIRSHFRSPSYSAVSAGRAPIALVPEYIEAQRRPAPMR